MAETPRFSVTIPAYNAEKTLEQTVESVRAQDFSDWEMVICDDGSTDGTLELCRRLSAVDSRIRVLAQENRGSGGAYNTAVRAARGSLLVMLSADDLLLPGHLAALDAFIEEQPDASIFTCDGYFEYEDGAREPQNLNRGWSDPARCGLTDLLNACFFGIGAVYRREIYDEVGGFREDMYAEDYIFWLFALAQGYEHRLLKQPLAVHRRSRSQKSADALRVRQADVDAIEALLGSDLLSADERSMALKVVRRHKWNIATRRVAGGLFGSELSSRAFDRIGAMGRRTVGRRNGS